MGEIDQTAARDNCCGLGIGGVLVATTMIVVGALGAHKVIHLSKAGQRALFGVAVLPGLLGIMGCGCACKCHQGAKETNRLKTLYQRRDAQEAARRRAASGPIGNPYYL